MSITAVAVILGTRVRGEWKHEPLPAPNHAARLVLLGLANYVDEDGSSWPSVEALAGHAGCSERTVQRALRDLVEAGLIEAAEDDGPERYTSITSRYRPVRYRLTFLKPGVTNQDPGVTNQDSGVTDQDSGVTDQDSRGDNPGTSGVTTLSPDPLIEPSPDPLVAEFDELWKLYPKRSDRADALRCYKARRRQGVTFDELRRAVVAYSREVEGTEKRWIMRGATFFGPNERWVDYAAVPEKPSKDNIAALGWSV